MPEVLTVEQTAERLGISRSLAYQAVRSGEIPAKKVGRRWLISATRLDSWLQEGR